MKKTVLLLALALACVVAVWLLLRVDAQAPRATELSSPADIRSRGEAPVPLADPGPAAEDAPRRAASVEPSPAPRLPAPNERSAVPENALAGVLTDQDGQPLASMRLWAFPAELIAEAKGFLMRWTAHAEARAVEMAPPGAAPFAQASTGQSGHFRFDHLRPGSYFIAAANDLDLDRTTLQREVFSTGDLSIRLVLTPYWLRVRAVGMDEEEKTTGVIYCREVHSDPARIDEPTWEAEAAPERALFPVEAGRTYVYGWISEPRPPSEARVTIAHGEPTTLRFLQLGPPVEKGLVIVRVRKPDGSPWSGGCNLRAYMRASGRELTRSGGEAPLHIYLPPGAYVLRVDVTNSSRMNPEVEPRDEDRYGITEVACEVRPGGTTEVDARLWQGGLLDLTLYADPEMSEREAANFAEVCAVRVQRGFDAEDAQAGEVWPVMLDGGPGHRRPLRLERHYDTRRRKEPATVRIERGSNGQFRPAGEVALRGRAAIEPGNYELRIHLPGYEPIEKSLWIRSGEDEPLTLALTRSKWTH
jgi:hypothetical protein